MITEIPTSDEFQAAGLNQLHLAWQIAIRAIETYEDAAAYIDKEDHSEATNAYWRRSQPALANAFGLIQQAMEMALKGRIAAISPYLLIARDPKDWPKGVEAGDVPFSEFRTLDAADLVKVHNVFSSQRLDAKFREFWESVRRDRNKVMHSVSARAFEPVSLIRAVLIAAKALFGDLSWPRHLIGMEENGTEAALGLHEYTFNTVLRQVALAIDQLSSSDKRHLLGHQTGRRVYLCPNCYKNSNHDYQEEWPHLAQLVSRDISETSLKCIVCGNIIVTERRACTHCHCAGNVIFEEKCLTCHGMQDDPRGFDSRLADPAQDLSRRYHFAFHAPGKAEGDQTVSPQ